MANDRRGERYRRFREFWRPGWFDRDHPRHEANQAIYQNTIDYNLPPGLSVPNYSLPLHTTRDEALRLWDYASDPESEVWRLSFAILDVRPPDCGVRLNPPHRIGVYPRAKWLGTCLVTVQVADPLGKSRTWPFQVTIWEPTAFGYLPLVLKANS